ncbi:MAG: hypothetical protein PF489_08230 [Salinivirgaceae bacterium]|nr:hypothetical protein [Salinivirgaceae bacterium]
MKLNNRLVEFEFNQNTGEFSILDKRDKKVCIENAFFQINEYASNQGYSFESETEKITDGFGSGEKLTIEGKKQNQPSIFLEVYLYANNGCVVLNTGIENTSDKELRIMKFSPLSGIAYKGFKFDDYKVLDGEIGYEFTTVSTKDTLKSKNNFLATFGKKGQDKRSLVAGGLSYNEFRKYASVIKTNDFLKIELKADDPVGKLVDAKSKYILKDKFYIDFITDNRFEALEKYGKSLAIANNCDVSGVTIPILNFWYSFVAKFGGDEFRNNSIGTLYEMGYIMNSGFLKYSPVGLRLEPDDYALPSNQQGWWDNEHWQMYKGGQLLKPYNTIESWGEKVQEMGGVPFIYCQTAKRSQDYCLQFPEHTLFNDPYAKRSKGRIGWWGRNGDSTAIYWAYDYTDPDFISHMKDVYKNLRSGGVQGIKFDYPSTGWSYDGGFEDKYATTTSAYRNIFKLAYEGLGPNRDVQERIPPYGDVALGVVTTQRTEGDNDRVYPGRVTKTGLRWYKNRIVTNYDCDPINPNHVYPTDTEDGWKAAITMTYTTSGRIEIGKYFEKMTKSMLFDLSRAVPLLASPANSARPIDAFSGKLYPEVYDFTVKPDWHIITFYNTKIEGETWPTDVMAYWEENKQFIPKKMVSNQISVSLSDKTDDGGLAFDPKKSYYVCDFWNWNYLGKIAGNAQLEQELRPGEARIMAVHEVKDYPQFISTSRHILQGYLDMTKHPEWDENKAELSGTSKLIGEETYKIVLATNGYKIKNYSAQNCKCELNLIDEANSIYELSITSDKTADVSWIVAFENQK